MSGKAQGQSDERGAGASDVDQAQNALPSPPRHVAEAIEQSQLPQQVCETIQRVVQRSRLWPSERLDVACELIAHFQDGIEAGKSVSDLMDEFGDIEQAAKLIRRAKKRNRPAWWRMAKRTVQSACIVIASLIVFYIGLAAWYYTGEPTIRRDYIAELNAVPATVPAEDRAWPAYREALTPLQANETLTELAGIGSDHERWPELRAELKRHAHDLERLRQATAMPGLGFIAAETLDPDDRAFFGTENESERPSTGLPVVLLSYLTPMRNAAMILAGDARLAAEEGDHDRATANIVAMLRMSQHIDEHPTLINQLVTFAIMAVTINALGELLSDSPDIFRDDDLLTIAHTMAATTGTNPIRIDLRGERMFFEDFVQRIYTDDGRGGGRFTPKGFQLLSKMQEIGVPEGHAELAGDDDSLIEEAKLFLIGPALAFVMADRREIMRRYDEILSAMEREMAMPLWRAEFEAENALNELMESGLIMRVRYLIVGLLLPAIRRTGVTAELTTQRRDAAQAMIALELYRRRYGRWPTTLEELTPRFLPSVPLDRYDGEPLRYLVRDGQVVLYSVGSNRTDNGGRPAIGRDGQASTDAASRWIPPDQVAQREYVPDGDWILWQSR
jgi:hypothetical protein